MLESHLPFVQISSTYQKWLHRPETGIKDGFQEMETNYCLEKHDNFFRCFVALNILPWNDPKSCVPFTFQPDFPETFCKM